ncbi:MULTISPECIES: hypothetical protein [Deinococcus]|uniref:Integral membrane protein n=1 Tax=Deinococcus rufus TaxID=2136097 RepID=A0ABV7Z649_9DEIO|nr:hypothetical protein [Deinococcus sp. AB2017081]WQE97214.1 hypothetical protein U2P90_18330 [Deinococcus sp. AB2017081]
MTPTHTPAHLYPGLLLLTLIGWMHFRDVPSKLAETPYLGWLYILLVAGCAAAGAWLLSSHWRNGYLLGGVISVGAIVAYSLTRSTGLPGATGDIGNWAEPSGLISLGAEAAFALLALLALRGRRQDATGGF